MEILIHTYGRAKRQITYDRMPRFVQKRTTLVVQHRERDLYGDYPIIVLPPLIQTLSHTRQWIIENYKLVYMLDDDLYFYKRDEHGALQKITSAGWRHMLRWLEANLEHGFCHAGISDRFGNQNEPLEYKLVGRMSRALAYDCRVIRSLKCRFDRVPIRQDFDMTLQLLQKGCANVVSYKYAQDQCGGSNTKGGVSEYRTPEMMKENALWLEEKYPGIVTAVKKKTKASWKGEERWDVRIRWKKAYEERKK